MSRPPEDAAMRVSLDAAGLPVSYLSSLLRVIQALLREIARSEEATQEIFEGRPQPLLQVTRVSLDTGLVFHVSFVDPLTQEPMPDVSHHVFARFLDRFAQFLASLPQPGLWGRTLRGPGGRPRTDMERRMDRLRVELRHFRRVALSYGDRSISVEGDRVEIT